MTKPIAFTGVIKTGPLAGKTLTHPSQRYEGKFESAEGEPVARGFYVFRRASGPAPGEWKWIPTEKAK